MGLVGGAMAQLRVVHALILRETRTRFGAHRLGYVWALLEPTFWIMTFYGMFVLVGRRMPSGMEAIPFLATGIITYELFAKTADRVSLSINANRALLYYPRVHTVDLIYARGALEMGTSVTVFVLIVGGHALVQQRLAVESLLTTVLGMGLCGLLGMSFGVVLCTLAVISNSVERIKGPLMRPMFWISGLFFTAADLPTSALRVLEWNPVLHCVELVRDGWFPSYHTPMASPAYVVGWILAFSFIGLTLERAVRHKVQLS